MQLPNDYEALSGLCPFEFRLQNCEAPDVWFPIAENHHFTA